MSNENMILDYIVEYLNKNEGKKQYLLKYANASLTEKFAVSREISVDALSKLAVGEGCIPISTTDRGFINIGFRDPIKRTGLITSTKQCTNRKFHHKMATKDWCVSVSKYITYDLILSYLGLDENLKGFTLTPDIVNYVSRMYLGACNVNPSYRRERYNLELSLKEYKDFPEELDRDSVAGMNLTVTTEMLIRMIILEEDGEGNKKYLKKSEFEGNPLIRMKFEELVYSLAKKQVKPEKKEAPEPKKEAEKKDTEEKAPKAKKATKAGRKSKKNNP